MKRTLLPLLALALAGCRGDSPPLDMATTPEKSRAALTAAFDAWKAGATAQSLAARSPAVYLLDDSFAKGSKLLDYRIEGEPKVVGIGMTYLATLTLQDGANAPATRKLAYRVVTAPNTAISREEGAP